MTRRGRPLKPDGALVNPPALKHVPMGEKQIHRDMKEFYLSLPKGDRSFSKTGRAFNTDPDIIANIARRYNWIAEAEKLDAQDPFIVKHRKEFEKSREDLFVLARTLLKNELARAGIEEEIPKEAELKDQAGDIEGAAKECVKFVKDGQLKGKDYKDILNIVELFKKVIEWNSIPEAKNNGIPNQVNLNSYKILIKR